MRLEEITIETLKEAIELEVHEEQKKFVASNVMTVAQSKFFPNVSVQGIFEEGIMVGFVALLNETESNKETGYVYRFMIGAAHQGKGYGKKSMHLIIEKMKENNPSISEVRLTVVPENLGAKTFYENFGFKATGEIKDGEEEYLYKM
ncbi:MAG: GNAT family N-acetyltransferase [Candidatus Heimdallarchaeota archaeon]|nr:GNAT family N-acetyltransferase [Candidatus Heimdallarchaeota archaeon]